MGYGMYDMFAMEEGGPGVWIWVGAYNKQQLGEDTSILCFMDAIMGEGDLTSMELE